MTLKEIEEERARAEKYRIPPDGYAPQQCNEPMRPMTTEERLNDVFQYHNDPSKIPNYTAIRTAAKHLAEVIFQNTPPGEDRRAALRCVREACLWANAAVALEGRSL